MFTASEKYYDTIYSAMGKDYAAEANKVHAFIQKHKRTEGNSLLDIACGTGRHAGLLSNFYAVDGIDLDPHMVKVARRNHPQIRFHQADMISFDLRRQFDAIVCLFSSIGYVKTKAKLQQALKAMSRHLLPGGVLLIEPWFAPDRWPVGSVRTLHVNQPELKITRMSHSGKRGTISTLDFHYLIGTPKGVEYSYEHHELGLFTHAEYLEAFGSAGLKVFHNKKGLNGRGLYSGKKITP